MSPLLSLLTDIAEADGTKQIRMTAETPPRVSVIDIISLITGHDSHTCSVTAHDLQKAHPSLAICDKAKLPGPGRHSYVCKVDQLEQLLAVMPGKAAAEFRATGKRRKREPQTDDLYVMKYSNDNGCVKIGRSECVEKRRRSLESGQNFFVEVVVIFPGKGHLEPEVHSRLQHFHSKAGAGKEWFNISAADATLVCSAALKEIEQQGDGSACSNGGLRV
jgi:hypothetical protein